MIQTKDIPVLARIFFPECRQIFALSPDTNSNDQVTFWHCPQALQNALRLTALPTVVINLKNAQHHFEGALGTILGQASPNGRQYRQFPNPDGSIRWLAPASQREPYFLQLYNGSGWRGRLLKALWSLTHRLRTPGLLAKGILTVCSTQPNSVDECLTSGGYSHHALFTGTTGENRKAIIALGHARRAEKFAKIPLTPAAKSLIASEGAVLDRLSRFEWNTLLIPQATVNTQGLLVSNVAPGRTKNGQELSPLHIQSLYQLYNRTNYTEQMKTSSFGLEMEDTLHQLAAAPEHPEMDREVTSELIHLLQEGWERYPADHTLTLACAHGDFTPWNQFVTSQRVHLYDWELSADLPLLYDAFHFIFQTGILVKRSKYSDILRSIQSLEKEPVVVAMLSEYQLSFWEAYHLYLLRHISYYLLRYLRQPNLHAQVYWMMNIWVEALRRI